MPEWRVFILLSGSHSVSREESGLIAKERVDSLLQNFSCCLQAILSKCSVQHLWTPQRWVLEGPSLSSPLEEMHRVRKCVFVWTGIYGV